ncbi:MAG: ATP-binding protein [Chloroflexota bacterium]|nr:ATP-binding protein [Chloroflexota bacterium]
MTKQPMLKSFRLKNFKAIRDSGVVKFSPLTALIGDNGSGKSSLVEGLQTYQRITNTKDGLDEAMQMWRGFEYVHNPPLHSGHLREDNMATISPIEFELSGLHVSPISQNNEAASYRTIMKVNKEPSTDLIFIEKENVYYKGRKVLERDSKGVIQYINKKMEFGIRPGDAIISRGGLYYYAKGLEDDEQFRDLMGYGIRFNWQFFTLNPWIIGEPQPIQRTAGAIRLRSNGSNIAEYLHHILEWYPETFEGILEALKYVLPYMRDLKPVLTGFLGHQMHLEMTEDDFKVMGWLLSTGTLRLLALLALFRHPEPPPLIVIEEIENGLDPRTIHLIVDEIQDLVESGLSQVIVTTHSPYLLDLLPLSTIVLVERGEFGPTFSRPADDDSIQNWSKKFAPGKLYTMGNLNRHLAL